MLPPDITTSITAFDISDMDVDVKMEEVRTMVISIFFIWFYLLRNVFLVWLQPDVLIKKRKLDSNVRSEFEVSLSKIKKHLDEMEALINSDAKIAVLEQSHIEHKSLFDQLLLFGQDIIADGLNGHYFLIFISAQLFCRFGLW